MEYEHNISQQLYVSNEIWDLVKGTKEKVALYINDLAKKTDPNTSSIDLTKQIMDKLIEDGESPVYETIREIKAEARRVM